MFRKSSYSGPQRSNRHHSFKRFGQRPRFSAKKINPALFVKKAEDFITIEDTKTTNLFTDFGLRPELVSNVLARGFGKPTKIQDQVIPHILANRDVLGIANTGTGKTAAFALPLINKILNNPSERMIVITPTRELAIQIKEEFRAFTLGLRVYLALAIGGAFIREQIQDIRRGPNVIIGTPGRIKDLGNRHVIDFKSLNTVVLDEVDRMLDMGFIGDIRHIIKETPTNRQTLFFSATIDKKTEPLIGTFLKNPVSVSVETQNPSTHVDQNIVSVPKHFKEQKLHELVAKSDFKKVLVFGSTQMIVEKLSRSLTDKGFPAGSLHGGKKQSQRQSIVKSFREDRISILVATDVAARGLDIADITHVINYDQPNNYQDYIHRIGRTGRGNSKGYALTFVE